MRLLAVDSNSVLNRAFYGVRPLTTKDGLYTHAVYGFMNILLKVLADYPADAIAFAFDMSAPTFRHTAYEGYKATRKGMPEELAVQLPLIKELLTSLGYPIIEIPGFEADDILGTLSRRCEDSGWDCIIVTGDRDSMQLISDKTNVLYTSTKAGKSEAVLYDPAGVAEKYGGLSPKSLIELKALMGDTSDNIPGVPGVGEKTALKLVADYGDIDSIYNKLDVLDIRDSLRKKLSEGKELAYMSRELATINCEAPVEPPIDELKRGETDNDGAYRLLTKLEMFRMIERLGLKTPSTSAPVDEQEEQEPETELSPCEAEDIFSLSGAADIIIAYDGGVPSSVILRREDKFCSAQGEKALELLDRLIAGSVPLRLHGAKPLYKYAIAKGARPHIEFDLELAAYLINPNATSYSVERLSDEYIAQPPEASEKGAITRFIKLCDMLSARIDKDGQTHLLTQIEQPLCEVLADMELIGFSLDTQGLVEYGKELSLEIESLTARIYELCGGEFNLNSPKQLGEMLFDRLGLPAKRKTKTGYSTDADVLDSLRDKHPVIELILNYRKLSKLNSTYVTGLGHQVSPDGRVRTQFRQTETRTGRISSVEPNMQNIPIRTELGSRLRRFFTAAPGHILVDADYSQIELRVLAHIAGDKVMIDAFKNNEDIHTITASQVFDMPPLFVTPAMRSRAKAVNFGIVYGIGAFSLSQDIGVTVSEADAYIKGYLSHYPGVKQYMEDTIAFAKKEGYVKTLFGRRRQMPELTSSNHNTRSFGERVAMNTPIQGTAADIIKLAMVKVYARLKKENLKSRLILQVHDELILEAPLEEAELVSALLKQEMENAAMLKVPLTADVHTGGNWLEAK